MVKYTVIIPLYNKKKHVARAVQSVLAQSYSNFEVIVVDDGSVDGGLEIVTQIKDERIRVYHQANSGVSSARNKGIRNAVGDYIAFLDADDEWLENHLESFEEMILKFPDAGLYATAHEIHESAGNVRNPWREEPYCQNDFIVEIDFFKESCKEDKLPVHSSSVCIPMQVLDNLGGFIVGSHHGEDLEMWGRIAIEYPVVFHCNVSSRYYKDSDNRSIHTRPVAWFQLPFVTYFHKNKKVIENKIDNPFIKEYVAMQELLVARRLITCGNRRAAWKVLVGVRTKHQRKKLIKFYLGAIAPMALIRLYQKINKSEKTGSMS